MLADEGVLEQDAVPGQGGQPEHAFCFRWLAVVGRVDVDEQLGMGEPEVEHRHQALSTRHDQPVIAGQRQRFGRSLDRGRSVVPEGARLHRRRLYIDGI